MFTDTFKWGPQFPRDNMTMLKKNQPKLLSITKALKRTDALESTHQLPPVQKRPRRRILSRVQKESVVMPATMNDSAAV